MLRANDPTARSLPASAPLRNRSVAALRNDSFSRLSDSNLTESYTDTTSVAIFPRFRFDVGELSSLSKLLAEAREGGPKRKKRILKFSFLAAVLEVDGPIAVNVKQGPDAGTSVPLLKLIVGEENGAILPLTVWRETADIMAGFGDSDQPGIKRGDVVAFQSRLRSLMVHQNISQKDADVLENRYTILRRASRPSNTRGLSETCI